MLSRDIPRLVADAFGSTGAARQPFGATVHEGHCAAPALPLRRSMLSGGIMSDLVSDRIERALKRIEVAAASQALVRTRLEARNEALRARIESAIVELDALIAVEREAEAEVAAPGDEEDES